MDVPLLMILILSSPRLNLQQREGTNVFHYVQLTLTDTEIPTADSGTST